MHSDHAEDQKKAAKLTVKLKKEYTNESLGRKLLKEMTSEQLQEILEKTCQAYIDKLGGIDAWSSQSPQMQRVHTDRYTAEVASQLGEKALGEMNNEERDEFDLFLWAGCCMHKLLNSVKGAMTEIISSNFYALQRKRRTLPITNPRQCCNTCRPICYLFENASCCRNAGQCHQTCSACGCILEYLV